MHIHLLCNGKSLDEPHPQGIYFTHDHCLNNRVCVTTGNSRIPSAHSRRLRYVGLNSSSDTYQIRISSAYSQSSCY